jgi:predicted Zn-dependent peptidase
MNTIAINKPGNTTYISISIPIGAINEYAAQKGISHFIEHMVFKGTKNFTAQQINREIEDVGGELNAYTSENNTCYWAKVPNQYLKKADKLITDLAFNAIFPKKEVDKEREVIIQEYKMYEDKPEYYVDNMFDAMVFSEVSTLNLPTVGTPGILMNIDRKQLLNRYVVFNTRQEALKVIIGDINNTHLPEYRFSNGITPWDLINRTAESKVIESKTNISQAQLIVGNLITRNSNFLDQWFEYILLENIFNGLSGRLFEVIREKNNMAYAVRFNTQIASRECTKWAVAVGLDKKNVDNAIKLIEKELRKPITESEYKRALTKTIGSYCGDLDDIRTNGYIVESAHKFLQQENAAGDYICVIDASEATNKFKEVSLTRLRELQEYMFDTTKKAILMPGEK